MKRTFILIFSVAFILRGGSGVEAATTVSPALSGVRQLVQAKDELGLRIFVRKAYSMKIGQSDWFEIKNTISAEGDRIGYDLVPFWNARNLKGKNKIDLDLDKVDELYNERKYEEGFRLAQSVAQRLRVMKSRADVKYQMPFVFHEMARGLYSAGRYEEALKVYQWIGISYPYFSQVLFEKMWAGFKSGRVDLALGAIASQRSVYFTKYISPESYLVQTYLYRRLCRDDDQKEVVAEMKAYQELLEKPDSVLPVVTDTNTLVLSRLANAKPTGRELLKLVTREERVKEQNELRAKLTAVAESQRPKILKDLKTVIAYQQLTNMTDMKTALKPVRRMKSRDDLLKQNLEVWPADSKEEWLDEIGKHVLIGESLCKSAK